MKKKNKFLKIIQWFFEEDESEDSAKNDDHIELGWIQLIIIILITAIFLFWIFFEPIKGFLNRPDPKADKLIEMRIEKNYFAHNAVLKNRDFSKGIKHWATSDGGILFPNSKSTASIESKEFHSAPNSLRIACIAPANRYHYSKKAKNGVVNNVYSDMESVCWLGVIPGKQIKASLWYKGDIVKFSINYMTNNGEWGNVGSVTGITSSQWARLEINKKIPLNARAIMLEITLNQAPDMPLPSVLIDDINIEIED